MKVWVVMGNDYPDSVFWTEEAANRYCEERRNEPGNKREYGGYRIYWRAYGFEVSRLGT